MATQTFTVTSGNGDTSTISVNRDIEAGVRTFQKSNGNSISINRKALVIDSDRKGESRPLLSKLVGKASAAYSLRDLNDKQGNNKVITVLRSGDNATREFKAKELNNNTLRDWVREPFQRLGARTARLGQSNTNVSGFSTTWASDYRRVSVNKSAVTSGNKKVRIYDKQTDVDNSISSFPAKLKVEFYVSQIAGDDINTRTYTHRVNPITNFGIYLSVKDDDVDVNNPVYSNKRFFKINRGFNSIEFELFDDGDSIKPSIDILLNGYSFGLQLVISNISITNLTGADGFVTKWHDQSGNDNDATGSVGSQPKIVEDGSKLDAVTFVGSDELTLNSSVSTTHEFNVNTAIQTATSGSRNNINETTKELVIYPSDQSLNSSAIEANIKNQYNIS